MTNPTNPTAAGKPESPAQTISTLPEIIADRISLIHIEGMEGAAEDQKHLDDGSDERVYWHYGYVTAMKDILNLITPNGAAN